jgi:hypothetical protein
MWVISQQISRRFQELQGMGTKNKKSSKVEETRPTKATTLEKNIENVSTLLERCTFQKIRVWSKCKN